MLFQNQFRVWRDRRRAFAAIDPVHLDRIADQLVAAHRDGWNEAMEIAAAAVRRDAPINRALARAADMAGWKTSADDHEGIALLLEAIAERLLGLKKPLL